MHYKHCENMWSLRLWLHWIWSLMLLRYNVSHMGQHFWIKQSGGETKRCPCFARRQLLFHALSFFYFVHSFFGARTVFLSAFSVEGSVFLWMNRALTKASDEDKTMTTAKGLLMNVLSCKTRWKNISVKQSGVYSLRLELKHQQFI